MAQRKPMDTRRFLPLFLTPFFGFFNDTMFRSALVLPEVPYKTVAVIRGITG